MKILLQNIQMGIGVTRGYFQYPLLAWGYLLPHPQNKLNILSEYIKKEEIDIALFTEVDRLNQLEMISRTSGLGNVHFFPTHLGHGNGVVSNCPLSNTVMDQLPQNTRPSFLNEKRYFCRFKVVVDEKDLTICLTHLSLISSERKKQISAINEALKDIKGPIILAGDFNVSSATELDDIACLQRISDYKTFPSWNPITALDHFLISDDIKDYQIKVTTERFSDHLGLVLELSNPRNYRS